MKINKIKKFLISFIVNDYHSDLENEDNINLSSKRKGDRYLSFILFLKIYKHKDFGKIFAYDFMPCWYYQTESR